MPTSAPEHASVTSLMQPEYAPSPEWVRQRDECIESSYRGLNDSLAAQRAQLEQALDEARNALAAVQDRGDSAGIKRVEARIKTLEASAWGDDTEKGLERSEAMLYRARSNYVTSVAQTRVATFRRFNLKPKLDRLDENPQFMYEVRLGVVLRYIRELEEQNSLRAPEDERAQRVREVVTKRLFGMNPDEGELDRLNEEVRRQRLLSTGFYEVRDQRIEEKQDKSAQRRLQIYRTWHRWSHEGAKGWGKKAGVISALGAIGIIAGASGVGVLGGGLFAVFSAGGGGLTALKLSRTQALQKLEKKADALQADDDAAHHRQSYDEERHDVYQALHSPDGSHANLDTVSTTINRDFTEPALRQRQKNLGRFVVGAVSAGGAMLLGELLGSALHGSAAAAPHAEHTHTALPHQHSSHRVPPTQPSPTPHPHPTHHAHQPPHSHRPEPREQPHHHVPKHHTRINHAGPVIHTADINDRYVSQVYEQRFGLHHGFQMMLNQAHAAIAHHELLRIQPDPSDPDDFYYKLTKKGAKLLGKRALSGSTRTLDVMRVLTHGTHIRLAA